MSYIICLEYFVVNDNRTLLIATSLDRFSAGFCKAVIDFVETYFGTVDNIVNVALFLFLRENY